MWLILTYRRLEICVKLGNYFTKCLVSLISHNHTNTCTHPFPNWQTSWVWCQGERGRRSWSFNNRQEGDSAALSSGQHNRTYLKIKSSGNPNKGSGCMRLCVLSQLFNSKVTHVGHAYAQNDLVGKLSITQRLWPHLRSRGFGGKHSPLPLQEICGWWLWWWSQSSLPRCDRLI